MENSPYLFLMDNDPDEDGEVFTVESILDYKNLAQYAISWAKRLSEEYPDNLVWVCFLT